MKRLLLLVILSISLIFTFGCEKTPEKTINVLIPAGSPSLGLVKLIHEAKSINGVNINYETTTGPDNLSTAIVSGSHDIVIAPTNLGANLYNKNANYLYAATVSYGNLFLVSTSGNITEGSKIAVFGKNTIPDIVLKLVLENKNLLQKVTLEYFSSVDEVSSQFEGGNYQFALLAEPTFSIIKSKMDITTIYNLHSEYKEIVGSDYPQVAIFINKKLLENKELVDAFLNRAQESIEFVKTEEVLAAQMYIEAKLKPSLSEALIIESIPNTNFSFETATLAKDKLISFFTILMNTNSNLIGGKIPDDGFFLSEENEKV